MLISGKSRSQDESRNWRVSIETLDFARVRTFTCLIGVGSPARGAITGRIRRHSRPMTGPHRRLLTSNIAGSGAPKMAGGRVRGSATREAQRPSDDVPGNHRLPPWTSLVDVVVSRAGWVRETAGNGRVSGAVAHLSISRRAARQRDAIADRMPGMGDHSAFFLCIQNRWVAVWGQT